MWRKNKCGEYYDVDCAIAYIKKMLPLTGYKEISEVGKKCEYRLYLWDYNKVTRFPNIMLQELRKNQEVFTFIVVLKT